MVKRFCVTVLFFLFFSELFATHIVGGELYYEYLGNNNYQVTLTVYRDCFNGVPPFDDPGFIGIWDANNTLLTTLSVSPFDSSTVPPIINSPCFIPPVNICYRVANYYSSVINLPPRPGGYQLAYQRCCRNSTILNIVGPLNTGATFYATIPENPADNSNPVFDQLPPPFICAGLPFIFNHHATDKEGDSLVYELCTPYDGASQQDPLPLPSSFPPPFNSVTYQPPYNTSNLLGGTPLTIDAQTGLLTATPNTIGQFVIGVCVNEYRNGVFLSKTRRDYQLNVVPCPSLVVAAIQYPILTCGSNTVQFVNNSFGASSYFWNFGDNTTLADTSHLSAPSYTYADTGTYTVTLIAYSTFNPLCADTITGVLTILPEYLVDFSYTLQNCSYVVNFNDSSNSDSGLTTEWLWNFGDNSTSGIITDPVHTFPGPGTYTVTLTATSARGCKKVLSKTVIIPPLITAAATAGQVTCFGSCTGASTVNTNNGITPFIYQWSDPLAQSTQTAVALCPGTYTVTVTDSSGCTATASATISEPQELAATASSTDAYCGGTCIGSAMASITGGTGPYTVSWNDPQFQTGVVATSLCPGWYTATITDINGCSTSDSVEVLYSNFIPHLTASISEDTVYLGQQVNLSAIANGNYTYSWTPASTLNNPNIQNPVSTPTENTTYYVTITDPLGCSNFDSVKVVVKPVTCIEPEIFIPNAFSPNGDNNNDIVFVRGNTIKELTFKIFDRWGEKVFETTDSDNGWDGYYKGKIATPAVYVYYVEATCFNNEKFYKQGNITLIR
jgi:gliding motility-associated-like protein